MRNAGNGYAEALYSLAEEAQVSEPVLRQIDEIAKAFDEEPRYIRILSAPEIGADERCRILDECFRGRVHEYVLNCLKLMTEKGHIRDFGACRDRYTELYNDAHGILPVKVFSARELDAGQLCAETKCVVADALDPVRD